MEASIKINFPTYGFAPISGIAANFVGIHFLKIIFINPYH